MKREDILNVDELKEAITSTLRHCERSLRGIFGEVVDAVDTVIDRYNTLDAHHVELAIRLDAVIERVTALEHRRGNGDRGNG